MGPPNLPVRGATNRAELLERAFAPERARITAACDAALAALPLPFIAAGAAGEAIQELRAHIEGSQIARRAAWLSDDIAEDFRWFSLWQDTSPGFDPCVFAFGGAAGNAFGVLLHPALARAGVPAPVVFRSDSEPPLLWVAEDLTRFEIMVEAGTRSAATAAAGTKHRAVTKLLETSSEERELVTRWAQEPRARQRLIAIYAEASATFASASLLAQGTILDAEAQTRARREEILCSLAG